MADELELERLLLELVSSLSPTGLTEVMNIVGVAAKKDLGQAIARDLGGDNQFSGWKRVRLVVGYEHTGPGQLEI